MNQIGGKQKNSKEIPSTSVRMERTPSPPLMSTILVSGYQSLYNVKLELGMFTVIHGESNVGKSALYRALRGLFTSATGDDFISYGEDKSGVAIQFSNDIGVAWLKKREQGSVYRLNDKVWKRTKGVPDEIKDVLRINSIDLSGDSFYPNLRGQFDGLFLLFESASKRAKVLGSLVSNFLLGGIREANLERNRNEADSRSYEGLLDGIRKEQTIDWKSHKEEAQKSVDLEDRLARLKELEKRIRRYQIDSGLLKSLQKKLARAEELQRELFDGMQKWQKDVLLWDTLRQEVRKWKSLRDFKVPVVELLSDEFWAKSNRLMEIGSIIKAAVVVWKDRKESCVRSEQEVSMLEELSVSAKKELVEAEKSATVVCPLCNGSYSILKLDVGF